MKKVKFLKLQNDGGQSVVAMCFKEGGVVKFEGSETLIENLMKDGVRSVSDPSKTLFPTDGDSFLDELPKVFNSPYLLATISED